MRRLLVRIVAAFIVGSILVLLWDAGYAAGQADNDPRPEWTEPGP